MHRNIMYKMCWFGLYLKFMEGQCGLGKRKGMSPTFGLIQLGWASWAGSFQPWKVWVLLTLGTCVCCEILEHLALLSPEEITNWSLFKRTWAWNISLIALEMKDEPYCLSFIQRLNTAPCAVLPWLVVINSQTRPMAVCSKNFQPLLCSQLHFGFLSGACMTSHNSSPVPKSVSFVLDKKCHWLMIDWCGTSAAALVFHIEILNIFILK